MPYQEQIYRQLNIGKANLSERTKYILINSKSNIILIPHKNIIKTQGKLI